MRSGSCERDFRISTSSSTVFGVLVIIDSKPGEEDKERMQTPWITPKHHTLVVNSSKIYTRVNGASGLHPLKSLIHVGA